MTDQIEASKITVAFDADSVVPQNPAAWVRVMEYLHNSPRFFVIAVTEDTMTRESIDRLHLQLSIPAFVQCHFTAGKPKARHLEERGIAVSTWISAERPAEFL